MSRPSPYGFDRVVQFRPNKEKPCECKIFAVCSCGRRLWPTPLEAPCERGPLDDHVFVGLYKTSELEAMHKKSM